MSGWVLCRGAGSERGLPLMLPTICLLASATKLGMGRTGDWLATATAIPRLRCCTRDEDGAAQGRDDRGWVRQGTKHPACAVERLPSATEMTAGRLAAKDTSARKKYLPGTIGCSRNSSQLAICRSWTFQAERQSSDDGMLGMDDAFTCLTQEGAERGTTENTAGHGVQADARTAKRTGLAPTPPERTESSGPPRRLCP